MIFNYSSDGDHPKLFVDRQHRFRQIVVDDMIIDFVCWLLRVNYGTLLMSSKHKRDYPGQRVDGDGQNVSRNRNICIKKLVFCFTRFSTLSNSRSFAQI